MTTAKERARELGRLRDRDHGGNKTIGRKLADLRLENNLLQGDVARDIKVSGPSISGIEKGRHCPRLRTLARLAAYFEVSLDHLAGHLIEEEAKKLKEEKP